MHLPLCLCAVVCYAVLCLQPSDCRAMNYGCWAQLAPWHRGLFAGGDKAGKIRLLHSLKAPRKLYVFIRDGCFIHILICAMKQTASTLDFPSLRTLREQQWEAGRKRAVFCVGLSLCSSHGRQQRKNAHAPIVYSALNS